MSTGSSECQNCPPNRYAVFVSTNDNVSMSKRFSSCESCPANAYCDGVVHADNGYFSHVNEKSGIASLFLCQPSYCLSNDKCGSNRRNPPQVNTLCAECIEGYVEWNGVCETCDTVRWGLIFGLLTLAFIFIIVYHWISQSSTSEQRIATYYSQIAVLLISKGDVEYFNPLNVNFFCSI